MEDKINTLKKMIEEAKLENDEVLVDYLTKSVEHLLEKQKTQEDIKIKSQENINQEENTIKEVKQEIQVEENKEKEEEKKEDNEIEEIISNGISTLTKFKSGKRILESPYMAVKVQPGKFAIKLRSMLYTLALDDATKDNQFIDEYFDILKTAETEQDINELLAYLQSIAPVGELGDNFSDALAYITEKKIQEISNKPKQEEKPKTLDITNKLNEINKSIEILDMELDAVKHNKRGVDSEDLYAIAKKYESKIEDLEDLYKNEIDKEKQIELEFKIDELRKKAKDIRAYASQIEELANFSFGL